MMPAVRMYIKIHDAVSIYQQITSRTHQLYAYTFMDRLYLRVPVRPLRIP
jgi:hypothetical protein